MAAPIEIWSEDYKRYAKEDPVLYRLNWRGLQAMSIQEAPTGNPFARRAVRINDDINHWRELKARSIRHSVKG